VSLSGFLGLKRRSAMEKGGELAKINFVVSPRANFHFMGTPKT